MCVCRYMKNKMSSKYIGGKNMVQFHFRKLPHNLLYSWKHNVSRNEVELCKVQVNLWLHKFNTFSNNFRAICILVGLHTCCTTSYSFKLKAQIMYLKRWFYAHTKEHCLFTFFCVRDLCWNAGKKQEKEAWMLAEQGWRRRCMQSSAT